MTMVDEASSGAESLDCSQIMTDKNDGSTVSGDIAHFSKTIPLKCDIANSKDLIHQKNVDTEVGCHTEGQPQVHSV